MKRFELTLVWKEHDKIQSIDKTESDDLVQFLCQFNFIIVNLQRKIHELEINNTILDDDIPF